MGVEFSPWHERLQQIFDLAATTPQSKMRILMLYLEGNAFRAAEHPKVELMTYDEDLAAQKAHLVPPETEEELRVNVCSRRQQRDEPVEMFARDVRLLCARAFPSLDAAAQEILSAGQFISGTSHRVTAHRLFLRQCKQSKKAVEYAKLSEAAFKIQVSHRRESALACNVGETSSQTSSLGAKCPCCSCSKMGQLARDRPSGDKSGAASSWGSRGGKGRGGAKGRGGRGGPL
jgi:hypothetical protein